MVNYKISVKEQNEYKSIMWDKDIYEGLNIYNLEVIDNFTKQFSSNNELNSEFIRIKALNPDFINKKLSIRYNYGKKENKIVMYGLALEDDYKFFDPNYMIDYLQSRYDDNILLEKLLAHYRNSYKNKYVLSNLTCYLMKLNKSYATEADKRSYVLDIANFVERECYKFDTKTHKTKLNERGIREISYRDLHELAMFLSNDYKTRIEPSIKEKQDKKILSKKQCIGQYSLFD